mmetsp:Transcript_5614/g.13070  ORF Transcript_5614/g.13070 Transcript_5614/m.13070 type:complete len:255 (-) Transcript_5614:844-1608(-)
MRSGRSMRMTSAFSYLDRLSSKSGTLSRSGRRSSNHFLHAPSDRRRESGRTLKVSLASARPYAQAQARSDSQAVLVGFGLSRSRHAFLHIATVSSLTKNSCISSSFNLACCFCSDSANTIATSGRSVSVARDMISAKTLLVSSSFVSAILFCMLPASDTPKVRLKIDMKMGTSGTKKCEPKLCATSLATTDSTTPCAAMALYSSDAFRTSDIAVRKLVTLSAVSRIDSSTEMRVLTRLSSCVIEPSDFTNADKI